MDTNLTSSNTPEEAPVDGVEIARFGNASNSTAKDEKQVEVSPSPHAAAAIAPGATDPFAHLPEDQANILKRQLHKTEEARYGFWAIFHFASASDVLIIFVSAVLAAASGAALPVMTIIFGGFQKLFQDYLALGLLSLDEFKSESAKYVLYFVYLAIGSFFATYLSNLGFLYTGEHIVTTIRQRYLEACLRQNIGFFDHLGVGEITVKITADANRIQDGISEKLGLLISSVSTLVVAFLIAFLHSWKLTLILTSAPAAILLNTAIWTQYIVKLSIPMAISSAQGGNLAQEAISAIRVLVAFAGQDRQIDKYDASLKSAAVAGVKLKSACALMMGIIMGLAHISYGLGFWQGSLFLARHEVDFQEMVTTLMSLMIGSFNIGAIAPCLQMVNEAVATSAGFLGMIDRESPLDGTEMSKGKKPKHVQGHIRLESVKHIYPSRAEVTAMDNVTLDVPSGKVTALVGVSGSGKSTIIGLIERFYNPVDGKILLDGRDIGTLNLRWLRQQIGLVAQEPVLFSGSIFENIRFGLVGSALEHSSDEMRREIVTNAAKNANVHEFISQLPDGYETNVGQRGSLLSGGQKQRIAIARAIVSNPKSRSHIVSVPPMYCFPIPSRLFVL
jgi:ATP-binding cassette subfamily B (MDR/TAP) protein 1